MRPEEKCVSLKTAKKLLAAGFPQDTEKWWCTDLGELTYSRDCSSYTKSQCGDHVAAPDAQEIGELLPATVDGKYGDCTRWFGSRRTQGQWHVWYENGRDDEKLLFTHENEAEARASAWLWLKEQKLI